MPRYFTLSFALRAAFALVLGGCLVAGLLPHVTSAADNGKQLQRVRGTIGYATDAQSTDFKAVFGKLLLPDDNYAVTRAQSAAVLAMPDSSLISLGENTNVQVGAFDSASATPGSTITVNGGTLRFDIRRPAGGAANYIFKTPTSQTAVRGTVGLLAFVNGVTTVGCVVCAADSVAVTVGTQTVTLITGQFLTVSALGAITTGALSGVIGTFTAAGVPATGAIGPAAAGIPAGAAAGAVVPVAAGAAAAAAAIGIAASQPSASPQATSTAVSPNATPSGSVNITSKVVATPTTTPHAPLAAPPVIPPHGPGTGPVGPPPGLPAPAGRRSQ
ncbi:MAG: FecR domain-containing protein [Candidatus Lustribacter sp.]|jgi:hypothetical protein